MSLLPQERETSITFDDSTDMATVYTCNNGLKIKLSKIFKVVKKDKVSITFECPKKCISFRNPVHKKKKISKEQLD